MAKINNHKLGKKNIEDILSLTPMQEGMLYHYLKQPHSSHYVEQLSLSLSGVIDLTCFEKAWTFVVESNEMLRTVFRWEQVKKPVQLIMKHHTPQLRIHDFKDRNKKEEKNERIEEIKRKDREDAFDLSRVPFRVTLCMLTEDNHEMIISNHHILYDGWSNGIILKEFFDAYNQLYENKIPKKPSKNRFGEFVKWLQQQDGTKQEQYWHDYLQGLEFESREKELDIDSQTGRKREKEIKTIGNYHLQFDPRMKEALEGFARSHKITLAALLYSAWGLLLQKYQSTPDVIFDTTVSGRSAGIKGIDNVVGLFINTIPLRVRTQPGETIKNVPVRLYHDLQQREQFENTSLITIKEYMDTSVTDSLFDSVLVIENYPLDKQLIQKSSHLSVRSYSIFGMSNYDLTVIITIFDSIAFNFTYNRDLFDEETLQKVSRHFISLVEAFIKNPRQKVSEIEVFPGEEKRALLEDLTRNREAVPREFVEYAAPRDEIEKKLADIWSEVLRIHAPIGIDDNFFNFGGHSLKAAVVVTKIHKELDVKVPLIEIFKRPTIRSLAQYIKESAEDKYIPINAPERKEYYALSSVQERMHALQQMDQKSTAYNVSSVMIVEGELKGEMVETFQAAYQQLTDHHENLRTSFPIINGKPRQKIHKKVDAAIEYHDAKQEKTHHAPSSMDHASIIKHFIRPFDLSQAPLLRVRLVKIEQKQHLFMMDMHHMITDGVSMDLFIKELSALCRGEQVPPVKRQYKDFSEWQNKRLAQGELKKEEDYWLHELDGELPVLNMLTDYSRPSIQQFSGNRVYFTLDKAFTRQLNRLVRKTGTTLFMVLMTALNILLHRYTSQEDIIIGTTIAGRDHADLENILGLFIETLVIRNYPKGYKTFKAFLEEVRQNTLKAFENDAYPFRELMRKVMPSLTGDLSRNPLFSVMLMVQNVDITELELEGLQFTPYHFDTRVSKVDITLEAVESVEEIKFHIEYSTALFKRETMERLAGHFINLLKEVTANPNLQISGIEILGKEEKKQILEEFKGSHWKPDPRTYPKDKRIEALFEQQVENTPDHIAVVYKDQQLTYRQLNEKANLISGIIKEL
jgi:non-ribosomal peptide synthetase component F